MTAITAPPVRIRLASQREAGVAIAHFRLMVMMLLAIGVTAIIIGKLMWMAIASDPSSGRVADDGMNLPRADILDRNGVPLATMIRGWSRGGWPN